ncbi:MAG: SpoVR family protein [Aquisalimonadaceae bacterium]
MAHDHPHHAHDHAVFSNDQLEEYAPKIEGLARDHGLDFYPVDFELVPNTFMMEVAVYGLPVRMPHWSFGVRYIYQYVQHRMGHSRIFEVVFPGNPNRAYLVDDNALAENTLVTAHVLGHADFSRNNQLFERMQRDVGYHIVEQAAARANRIHNAIEDHGQARVEAVLDAALALEQNIDINKGLHRDLYPATTVRPRQPKAPAAGSFEKRYQDLPGEEAPSRPVAAERPRVPPHPEYDLLWFIAHYGPELADWERDIFLAVREESFYFYPVFACQIMNEGWASYWHARLLREANFLPNQIYLDAIKTHSDVVRPYAGKEAVSLSVNPYHLGFTMWERIVADMGLDAAKRIRAEEDDFSFIRNYLDDDLAAELKLFNYARRPGAGGEERYIVKDRDINTLRENILSPKFNYGAPRIHVRSLGLDGSLTLAHDHETDGRGLDLTRARKVLEYIQRVWHRNVRLETVDHAGEPKVVEADAR